MFSVVKFPLEENSVAVISSSWLNPEKTQCYWPKLRGREGEKIKKLILDHANPNLPSKVKWQVCPCVCLKNCGDYSEARYYCRIAEEESNLESNTEETPNQGKLSLPLTQSQGATLKKQLFQAQNEDSSDPLEVSSSDGEVENRAVVAPLGPQKGTPQPVTRGPLTSVSPGVQDLLNEADRVLKPPPSITPLTSASAQLQQLETRLEKLETFVVEKLVAIHDDIKTLIDRTAHLSISTSSGIATDVLNLPVDTSDQFQELESWLEDPANFLLLQKKLSVFGGTSPENIADRLMNELLGATFASQVSLTGKDKSGQTKKAVLRGTRLLKLLQETIRLHKLSATTTNADVEKLVRRWIKNKNDCLKKQEQRLVEKTPGTSGEAVNAADRSKVFYVLSSSIQQSTSIQK